MGGFLITGASGFIGRRLVDRLANAHDIWAMAGDSPSDPDPPPRVRWFRHDIKDSELPEPMPERIDAVIHLAQSHHFREFPEYADEILAVNVLGTLNVLEWGRKLGIGRFIYVSTGGVSGPCPEPIEESIEFRARGPLAFYLTTKYSAELLVKSYAGFFTPIVIRPFFVYGPGQRPDMLLPRLIGRIRDRQPVTLQPPDGIRINPVHVDDVVLALERALDIDEGATVNVAGPETMTIREISITLGTFLDTAPIFEMEAVTGSPPGHLVADISEMKRLLRAPEIRFRDGAVGLFA